MFVAISQPELSETISEKKGTRSRRRDGEALTQDEKTLLMVLFDWPSALIEWSRVVLLPASSVLSAAYTSVIRLNVQ